MSHSGNSCDTKNTNFYQQGKESSSCDMTDAPAVARTAWNYGRISVQVNIKCSYQTWKKRTQTLSILNLLPDRSSFITKETEILLRGFISVINQLDAQNFCFTISLFHASTCFEHMCSSSGGQNSITQSLVSSQRKVAESWTPVHQTATFSCDDTRDCVIQFWLPDDEQICSKHVEAWNKLIVKQKFCASNWLITEINILRCTVSKTSKLLRSV